MRHGGPGTTTWRHRTVTGGEEKGHKQPQVEWNREAVFASMEAGFFILGGIA